jgi:uncharacterized protein GlcG (DUF336 family)|tara:strand:- start:3024 stop:5036 length:2013 start_codon:yes stop_codon:yes gene_type:complete
MLPTKAITMFCRLPLVVLVAFFLAGCGGSGSGGGSDTLVDEGPSVECDGSCVSSDSRLTQEDVRQVLSQALDQAHAMDLNATVAVVDRVGNVLAVYRMSQEGQPLDITSTVPNSVLTGLDGVTLPLGSDGDALGAIAKAITGAYLSSEGNAFSTRTASQIIQENFNPGELDQPAGPLYGVQFSQLPCSDFLQRYTGGNASVGPHRSPLGLAADPGGFPLYKQGTPVGGVGVISDGLYSLDKNVQNEDRDADELIAYAATYAFEAPINRRADRITVDGKTLRFSDIGFSDLIVDPSDAPPFERRLDQGKLIHVTGYAEAVIRSGTVFGQPESGIKSAGGVFEGSDAFSFVDSSGANRYPPRDGSDAAILTNAPLQSTEVSQILLSSLAVAARTRAQIRRPLDTFGRVTISVVDTNGVVLGIIRNRDAPVFGADVSLQKARTTMLLSSFGAADFFSDIEIPATYFKNDFMTVRETVDIDDYIDRSKALLGATAFEDGTAYSIRSISNIHRPFFPDGLSSAGSGPLNKEPDLNEWSIFSTGLQLDVSYNKIIQHVLFAATGAGTDVNSSCNESATKPERLANGLQIFASGVPIYRNGELVGGLGVAGDAPEQDEMMAFLGLNNAGLVLESGVGNAPTEIRADQLAPDGYRLRYVQCPQNPFTDSDDENVCEGK